MDDPATTVESTKLAALLTVGVLLLATLIILMVNLGNADGVFGVVLVLIVFGIALGLQGRFLWLIHTGWEAMTVNQRWKIAVAGVVVPILAAVAGFFALALLIALAIVGFGLRAIGVRSVPRVSSLFSGIFTTGLLSDAHGNRSGSIDPESGEIRDPQGNRTGQVDLGTGELRDSYGNRTGAIDRNTGEIRDPYGNRSGAIDLGTGEVRDPQGNRTGWID